MGSAPLRGEVTDTLVDAIARKAAGRRVAAAPPRSCSSCATLSVVSDEVSVRELRNHTAAVLRRVEAGERLRVTVDRRPVAELSPLPARDVWVPRSRALAALIQADAALCDELSEGLPDTVDEL